MVNDYTIVYLALVPKKSSFGICIFWAARHPANDTYNIVAQGVKRNEIQLRSESITDMFECVLVGISIFFLRYISGLFTHH